MLDLTCHQDKLVPEFDIKQRLSDLQGALDKAGIGAAWIEHKADVYYYTGSAQAGILLVPATGEPTFFVRRSLSRAEMEARIPVQPFPGSKGLFTEAQRLVSGGSLGMSLDVTGASSYLRVKQALGGIEIADVGGIIRMQRAVKSDWELEQVRLATAQVLPIFENLAYWAKPGAVELDISAEMEMMLRKSGHGGPIRIRRIGMDLAMIVVTGGASACYPHSFDGPVGGQSPDPVAAGGAGWRSLEPGNTLIADCVTSYNGYHGDNARVIGVGPKVSTDAYAAHAFCLEALSRLEEAIKPGRACADVFQEVDGWAKGKGEPVGFMGFGDNRVKFFGHGVGLELDEFPVIADRIDLELKPGMVIAVEPKAFLPEIGPVGTENTYILTESGVERLCPYPMDLFIATP